MRLHHPFSDGAARNNQSMEGLGRVVVGSAVGGLLVAAAFFAVDGLMPSAVDAVPTHLTCEDTTSTWNGSRMNYIHVRYFLIFTQTRQFNDS